MTQPDATSTPNTMSHAHIVCMGCGCLCDDIELDVVDRAISDVRRACPLGVDWFRRTIESAAMQAVDATVDSVAAEVHRLLNQSRFPVFLGLESLTTEAQRLAIKLAERVGGVVASRSCAALQARQEVGEVTCTLGEIKSRADVVVYWFCDPVRSHPRHLERYSAEPTSRFLPNGRGDRRLIAVGAERNDTSNRCDDFVQVPREREYDALLQLRLYVSKRDLGEPALEQAEREPLAALAQAMKRAKYGAMVFNPEWYGDSRTEIEAIFRLVRDLNLHTSFVAAPLGAGENAKGLETVLAWSTGFPANVALTSTEQRYNGAEFSAEELLKRKRVDAAIVFGAWNGAGLSAKAQRHLANIPTIRLPSNFHVSNGTVFRMDGVPLPVRRLIEPREPTTVRVLSRLLESIKAKPSAASPR